MADALVLTPSAQVKVTLPRQLVAVVKEKAAKLGLSVSGYIKHLVIDDARAWQKQLESMDLPEYPMSEKMERIMEQALEDHRQGKTIKMDL